MERKPQSRHVAPGGERKRYGGEGKPRSSSNGNTRWSGGKSFGGNGGRPSRDGGGYGGNRSRGRG